MPPPMCPVCGENRLSDNRKKRCIKCYLERRDIQVKGPPLCPDCGGDKAHTAVRCFKCNESRKAMMAEVRETRGTKQDIELSRARDAAKRYRKLYEQKTKEDAEEERLIRLFETSIGALPEMPKAARVAPTIQRKKSPTVETPFLALGDLHIGEVVELTATHGINKYDFDVFQDRLEHLEGRVLDILFTHQTSRYDELVIGSLGDNISGVIHDELQKYGAQHAVDQVFVGATCLAVFVQRLAAHFKRVRFIGIGGNHGRLSKQKESIQYYKNFDYLFNAIVATRLQGHPGIEVSIPKAIFTVAEVAKHKILISHGMELPPSAMGLPAYSVNRAAGSYQEMLRMVDEHYDYWILGHIHRPMELDNAIVNGCFPGLNEYGVGKLFKPVKPMQKLIGFHEHHGKSWEYPIQLQKAPKAKVYRFEHDMGIPEALGFAVEAATQ